MRKFLIAVLLAGAAASPAIAQHHGHHDDDNNNSQSQQSQQPQHSRGDHGDRGNRGDNGQSRQQARDAARSIANGGHASRDDVRAAVRDYQIRHQNDGQGGWDRSQQAGQQQQQAYDRDRRGNWNGGSTPAQRIVQQQIRQEYRSGDRNWESRSNGYYGQGSQQAYSRDHHRGSWDRNWRKDSRYDWRRYRNNHRSIFHLGFYYDPFGYGYSAFDIGYRLQPAYFGQQFWFDPAMYGLPYPPPGTQWVRYWNDAVLVDMYTGEVVDVIHGFFW